MGHIQPAPDKRLLADRPALDRRPAAGRCAVHGTGRDDGGADEDGLRLQRRQHSEQPIRSKWKVVVSWLRFLEELGGGLRFRCQARFGNDFPLEGVGLTIARRVPIRKKLRGKQKTPRVCLASPTA